MNIGMLLMLAGLALIAGVIAGIRWPRTWLALTVAGTLAALVAALRVLLVGDSWNWQSDFFVGGEIAKGRASARPFSLTRGRRVPDAARLNPI